MKTNNRFFNRNYQRVSTNRFVVDSDRFWRKEFHPRFSDIFIEDDYFEIIQKVNNSLSFSIDNEYIEIYAEHLYNYFSGFRFAYIPSDEPNSIQSFKSFMYFVLSDYFGKLSMSNFPLDSDDFNVVNNGAFSGKKDNVILGTEEHNKSGDKSISKVNITNTGELRDESVSTVENVDEENDSNSKTTDDSFLSPQNSGVSPTQNNIKHEGVNGFSVNFGNAFSTAKGVQNNGESTKNKSNTIGGTATTRNLFGETDSVDNTMESNTEYGMLQNTENTNEKTDHYEEDLHFDRAIKLQQFYNLFSESLWQEVIGQLSKWVLQVNIATSEKNYIGKKKYY